MDMEAYEFIREWHGRDMKPDKLRYAKNVYELTVIGEVTCNGRIREIERKGYRSL